MTRRLLLSYVSLAAVVLLCLEVPLGLLYARRERDALSATARRDATALAVLAGESLESPTSHDLPSLAATYRTRTGSEFAIYDRRGRILVGFDAGEPAGEEPDVTALVGDALAGRAATARRTDDSGSQLVAALPVPADGQALGAVVVAVPADGTDSRIVRAWMALGALAATVLAVAAAIGRVLARSLTAPLVNLQLAAQQFGQGDMEARALGGGPAEIAALADEFNAMAERTHQLVLSQRRFVADVSHQLRTPLTALRLRLENLAAGADATSFPEFEAAEAETQRLTRLVDGLLALSRAEDHRADRERIDVVAIASDRRDAWAPLAEERGVTLVVEAGPPAAYAVAVPGQVEQILDNLLSNSVEASPAGSQITIKAEVSSTGARSEVVIHISDEGPGMTATEREHAFDRFWQGRNRDGGAGLGLAIVQQLAESAGGSVDLRQRDGGGLDAAVTLCGA
ncbi:MAG: sensor histidine kinase [Acidimicrobiales bacterium]